MNRLLLCRKRRQWTSRRRPNARILHDEFRTVVHEIHAGHSNQVEQVERIEAANTVFGHTMQRIVRRSAPYYALTFTLTPLNNVAVRYYDAQMRYVYDYAVYVHALVELHRWRTRLRTLPDELEAMVIGYLAMRSRRYLFGEITTPMTILSDADGWVHW